MTDQALSIGILLAPTYRSRAVLQMFLHAGINIKSAILLPGTEPLWDGDNEIEVPLYKMNGTIGFKPGAAIKDMLIAEGIDFEIAPTNDVNTVEFINFIKTQNAETYIYSGVAGCILRAGLLRDSGKKFIHAHGGDAPRYSGSTAFYYSVLEEGTMGATVFWMDEGLDTGDVIDKLIAIPHHGIEIDRIQDPLIRAEAFVQAIRKIEFGSDCGLKQDHENRVTYHVIHPVLKHLALRKTGLDTV